MIIGVGTDITNCERLAKTLQGKGDQFIKRVFTQAEQDYAALKKEEHSRIGAYAKRFAAKEACAKALGTGIAGGITFQDIEVTHNKEGAPQITLHGKALERVQAITPKGSAAYIHVSLSDDWPFAQAFIVISTGENISK